jgi:hypothetical protein
MEIIQALKCLEVFKRSPTIFIIYVHNDKIGGIEKRYVKEMVQWLQDFGISVYSDIPPSVNPSPHLPTTPAIDAKGDNILRNQLCLLPGLPGSVDKIIFYGSTLLGEYITHTFYEQHCQCIKEAYKQARLLLSNDPTTNAMEVIYKSVEQVVIANQCDDGFHHVFTETAVTEIRHNHQEFSGIIPLLIDGEASESFPPFIPQSLIVRINILAQSSFNDSNKYRSETLHKGFYKLLRRLSPRDYRYFNSLEQCYEICVKELKKSSFINENEFRQFVDVECMKACKTVKDSIAENRRKARRTFFRFQFMISLRSLYNTSFNDRP